MDLIPFVTFLPRSTKTSPWNSYVKDALERKPHKLVCAGQFVSAISVRPDPSSPASPTISPGYITEVGIDARFMKELAATLSPGSSVLFVLTGRPTPDRDKLLEELKGTGGKILQTTLSHEDQSALQAALSAAREGS